MLRAKVVDRNFPSENVDKKSLLEQEAESIIVNYQVPEGITYYQEAKKPHFGVLIATNVATKSPFLRKSTLKLVNLVKSFQKIL